MESANYASYKNWTGESTLVVISDKREIAELFNAHFIQIADSVSLMKETDYGQHFENHSSIIAIHEKNKATDAWLCFNFEHLH